jgi:hypothetical protein
MGNRRHVVLVTASALVSLGCSSNPPGAQAGSDAGTGADGGAEGSSASDTGAPLDAARPDAPAGGETGAPTDGGPALLPLKASSNGRYVTDQNGVPFLILGDSPHSLLVNLSAADASSYMADRKANGFNSILVQALCNTYTGGNAAGTTYDGVAPFTTGSSPADYDLSKPNTAYFARLDALVSTAASNGLVVFLDPIDTGGWLVTLQNNGATKAHDFGAFLGARYKASPNIVWDSGNDFQSWKSSSSDNNLVYQVMAGIASADPNHLQTIELDYNASYSDQDTTLAPVLSLDSAYTYFETYDEVLAAYASTPTVPVFLTEANYEYENNTNAFSGTTGVFVLREQEYWAMTSGACGQLYGNHYTWTFDGPQGSSNWKSFLDSPGTAELAYWSKLFESVPWWKLVPDTQKKIVTAGYGTYAGTNGNLPNATYVTTAYDPGGSVAVIYDVAGAALTVDLTQLKGPVTAAWYDPSQAVSSPVAGSPFPNSGSHVFTTPGKNHDGQADWVLVLTSP